VKECANAAAGRTPLGEAPTGWLPSDEYSFWRVKAWCWLRLGRIPRASLASPSSRDSTRRKNGRLSHPHLFKYSGFACAPKGVERPHTDEPYPYIDWIPHTTEPRESPPCPDLV
jgi:hypothetical protein